MTPDWIRRIPTSLLLEADTTGLRAWLDGHGLVLSLAELDAERRRRSSATTGDRPRRRTRGGRSGHERTPR